MNDFNAKYIKISSEYLEEKLLSIKVKEKGTKSPKDRKRNSSIKKFVSSIFKS